MLLQGIKRMLFVFATSNITYLLHSFKRMPRILMIDIDFRQIKFEPDASFEFAVRYGNMAKWHL